MALKANETESIANILLIEPDLQKANEILSSLRQAGYEVDGVRGHLQGLSRLDDFSFDLVLVPVEATDIHGFEFCRLVRNREREFNLAYTYILLFAPQNLRYQITEQCEEADDFITEPFLQSELEWRLRKGQQVLEGQRHLSKLVQVDPETGVMNRKGLDLYFQEEINRLSRKQEWVSLVVFWTKGMERMGLDYGQVWVNWIRQQISHLLRKSLRNYDRLGKLEEGIFCLLAPETDPQGMQSIIKRLQSDFQTWSKSGSGLQQDVELGIKALSLKARLDYRGQRNAVQSIWEWIKQLVPEKDADKIFTGILDNSGIQLDQPE